MTHGTAISWVHFPDGYLGIPRWKGETLNHQIGCAYTGSIACVGCYAPKSIASVAVKFKDLHPELSERYYNVIEQDDDGHWVWSGKVETFPERLLKPPRWTAPRSVFVNSLTDQFWSETAEEDITNFLQVVERSWPSRFLVLTKRAARMRDVMNATVSGPDSLPFPIPNLWLGVSIGERKYRFLMDQLRDTPAAVRFVSFEPLVEDLGDLDLTGIDWAIVGGMSGPLHETYPLDPAWARRIEAQCAEQGVAFFFKQDSGPRAGMNPDLLGQLHHNWPTLDGIALHGIS